MMPFDQEKAFLPSGMRIKFEDLQDQDVVEYTPNTANGRLLVRGVISIDEGVSGVYLNGWGNIFGDPAGEVYLVYRDIPEPMGLGAAVLFTHPGGTRSRFVRFSSSQMNSDIAWMRDGGTARRSWKSLRHEYTGAPPEKLSDGVMV